MPSSVTRPADTGPVVPMHELTPGTDRYGADLTPDREGLWHFRVQAWGDPIAHWRHDAAIKVPIGQDVDLMLAEGALLFERAAREAVPAVKANGTKAASAKAPPRPGGPGYPPSGSCTSKSRPTCGNGRSPRSAGSAPRSPGRSPRPSPSSRCAS